jgi:molecular chaperone DnaK (HSP70)
VKNLLGRPSNDPVCSEELRGYTVTESGQSWHLEIPGCGLYTDIDLGCVLFSHLKSITPALSAPNPPKVILAVPQKWSDTQRDAIKTVAKKSGILVHRVINSTTAACLASSNELTSPVCIVHLGSGVLEITIVTVDEGIYEVLAHHVSEFPIGGETFDEAICEYCRESLRNNHGVKLPETPKFIFYFRKQCEAAKKELSWNEATVVTIEYSDTFHVKISRARFEELIKKQIQAILSALSDLLKQAQLSQHQIRGLVFTGGSMQIPKICRIISEYFENSVTAHSYFPGDEIISVGAANQAHLLSLPPPELMCLLNVATLSLGVSTAWGTMETLVHRNMCLPVKKKKYFTSFFPNQTVRASGHFFRSLIISKDSENPNF